MRPPTAVTSPVEAAVSTPSLVALALVVGAGPFSTDTYIAALPDIQRSLHTTASAAQLSITLCIIGLAIGMLFSGPLSDSRGRRPLLLISGGAFALAGLACAVAPSIGVLLALRLMQGAAAGASAAVGRAVVADRYSGIERAQKYGLLGAVTLIGPVIAPVIGGGILAVSDWRVVFAFMGLLGLGMLAATLFGVPETRRRSAADVAGTRGLTQLFSGMARVIRRPAFQFPLIVQCLATGGFFIYIGGSSFVLESTLGVSANVYSLVFASNALAMVAMSLVLSRTVARFGARRLLWCGVSLSCASVVVLAVVSRVAGDGLDLALVWPFLTVIVGGMGLTGSASTVLGQEAGSDASGAASSLLSGIVFLVGSATTPLTGLLGGGVPTMALVMSCFFVCAVVVLIVARTRSASTATM